jgi:hypothetical protein
MRGKLISELCGASTEDEYGPAQAARAVRIKARVKPEALLKLPGFLMQLPIRPLISLNVIDRSTWLNSVMQNNPHIMDLKERISPLHRAISFCRM